MEGRKEASRICIRLASAVGSWLYPSQARRVRAGERAAHRQQRGLARTRSASVFARENGKSEGGRKKGCGPVTGSLRRGHPLPTRCPPREEGSLRSLLCPHAPQRASPLLWSHRFIVAGRSHLLRPLVHTAHSEAQYTCTHTRTYGGARARQAHPSSPPSLFVRSSVTAARALQMRRKSEAAEGRVGG